MGARDNSGQRTLFYRVDGRSFAAASEIHPLLQDPAVPLAPNEERIRDFLVPLNMSRNEKERPDTFYAGISSLMPGHFLVLDQSGLRLQRYWELGHVPEIRYRDDAEYAEHFLDVFRMVVGARLRTSRPMGAMLSGGLDSPSVVSTAHTLWNEGAPRPSSFTAYSLVFDGLECDERPLIQDIQRRYGFRTEYVSPHGYYEWLQLEPRGFRPSPVQGLNERDALFGVASDGRPGFLDGDFADAGIRGTAAVFDSLLRRGRLGELRRRLADYQAISRSARAEDVRPARPAPLLPLWAQQSVNAAYTRRYFRQERWRLLPRWMPRAARRAERPAPAPGPTDRAGTALLQRRPPPGALRPLPGRVGGQPPGMAPGELAPLRRPAPPRAAAGRPSGGQVRASTGNGPGLRPVEAAAAGSYAWHPARERP